jgi:cobalt/nickel transport system permease protein
MGTLLVLSLRQAGDYYDAMLSRGYDGSLRFYEEKKPVTAVQAALGAVWALCPLAVWLVTR